MRTLGLEDELAAASGKLCRSLSCKLLVDLCDAERTDGAGKNRNAVSELLSFVIIFYLLLFSTLAEVNSRETRRVLL